MDLIGLGNIAKADGCQDGILDFLHEWKDEIFAKISKCIYCSGNGWSETCGLFKMDW